MVYYGNRNVLNAENIQNQVYEFYFQTANDDSFFYSRSCRYGKLNFIYEIINYRFHKHIILDKTYFGYFKNVYNKIINCSENIDYLLLIFKNYF